MAPMVVARVSEGLKTEIETLVSETGLWENQSAFIKEALDIHIGQHWQGERYVTRYDRD